MSVAVRFDQLDVGAATALHGVAQSDGSLLTLLGPLAVVAELATDATSPLGGACSLSITVPTAADASAAPAAEEQELRASARNGWLGVAARLPLPAAFRVRELLETAAQLAGLGRHSRAAVARAASRVGLTPALDRSLAACSALELASLRVALGLVTEPRVLLVERPFVALDDPTIADLCTRLAALASELPVLLVLDEAPRQLAVGELLGSGAVFTAFDGVPTAVEPRPAQYGARVVASGPVAELRERLSEQGHPSQGPLAPNGGELWFSTPLDAPTLARAALDVGVTVVRFERA